MKSTGIIMSGDLPVKIMNGTKTQTRRTAGLDHVNELPSFWDYHSYDKDTNRYLFWQNQTGDGYWEVCPYGQPGDQLWVREKHKIIETMLDKYIEYSDGTIISPSNAKHDQLISYWPDKPWRPSIHMFKKHSRITLTISDIRPERLHDITEEDAVTEGCSMILGNMDRPSTRWYFKNLWDSLNAKRGYSWVSNPWVFVISFKLVDK